MAALAHGVDGDRSLLDAPLVPVQGTLGATGPGAAGRVPVRAGQWMSAAVRVGGVLRNRPGDMPYSRRNAAENANSVE